MRSSCGVSSRCQRVPLSPFHTVQPTSPSLRPQTEYYEYIVTLDNIPTNTQRILEHELRSDILTAISKRRDPREGHWRSTWTGLQPFCISTANQFAIVCLPSERSLVLRKVLAYACHIPRVDSCVLLSHYLVSSHL